MGLIDDPLGFVFGDDGDQGAIDRRVNREDEGERWWQRWEATFGAGGPMDPLAVYPKITAALDRTLATPKFNLNFDGKSYPVTPSYAREAPYRYAAALGSLMDPWLQGGMELERGRYGSPYYREPSGGLVGTFGNSLAKSTGEGLGNALPFLFA